MGDVTTNDGERTLRCSFCGKSQDKTEVLVTGVGAAICDSCIEIAAEVVRERREAKASGGGSTDIPTA